MKAFCVSEKEEKRRQSGTLFENCFQVLDVDYYADAGAGELAFCMNGRDYRRIVVDYGEITRAGILECARCDRKVIVGALSEWQANAFLEEVKGHGKRDASWSYAAAFGSEETRKLLEKQFRVSCLRIPASADAFVVTRADMVFLKDCWVHKEFDVLRTDGGGRGNFVSQLNLLPACRPVPRKREETMVQTRMDARTRAVYLEGLKRYRERGVRILIDGKEVDDSQWKVIFETGKDGSFYMGDYILEDETGEGQETDGGGTYGTVNSEMQGQICERPAEYGNPKLLGKRLKEIRFDRVYNR